MTCLINQSQSINNFNSIYLLIYNRVHTAQVLWVVLGFTAKPWFKFEENAWNILDFSLNIKNLVHPNQSITILTSYLSIYILINPFCYILSIYLQEADILEDWTQIKKSLVNLKPSEKWSWFQILNLIQILTTGIPGAN